VRPKPSGEPKKKFCTRVSPYRNVTAIAMALGLESAAR